VAAFCRVADRPIYHRNQIYTPDHVIVLDESLLRIGIVDQGLKKRHAGH
jgi:Pyruvate/2-oxoacid:ferredoxin oxidoreductase gamma subunit